IGLQILQTPSVSDVVTDGKMRNMAIVGIVGAALSLLVAVLFDDIVGLLRRWGRRRRERRVGTDEASEGSASEADPTADSNESLTRERNKQATDERAVSSPDGAASDDGPPRGTSDDLAQARRDG